MMPARNFVKHARFMLRLNGSLLSTHKLVFIVFLVHPGECGFVFLFFCFYCLFAVYMRMICAYMRYVLRSNTN